MEQDHSPAQQLLPYTHEPRAWGYTFLHYDEGFMPSESDLLHSCFYS